MAAWCVARGGMVVYLRWSPARPEPNVESEFVMMKVLQVLGMVAVAAGVGVVPACGQNVRVEREFRMRGQLAHAEELSGVAVWKDWLVACADEGAEVNLLARDAGRLEGKVSLLADREDEIDMEGVASDERYVYIVGSHSMHREEGDENEGGGRSNRRRRQRAPEITPHEDSYSLFRLTLDDRGRIATNERISLRTILAADDLLGPFTKLPGKENGVDIEGVAVREGRLFVGFRGPVVRDGLAAVMEFAFEQPAAYEVKLVNLAGRGVRDLAAVEGGLLLLAGPMGEEDGEYSLYLWDGVGEAPALVGAVPVDGDAKPEGIAVLSETASEWRVLLICDGDATARELVVEKPQP
jgi:hypothetical protein